jgi:lipid II isoglutaminyl synthase (glutamine-hydrolysing)
MTGRGSGTALPGFLVEKLMPWLLAPASKHFRDITLITGTNGKTTTRALLTHMLEYNGNKVLTNRGGANIIRGIASSLLLNLNWLNRPRLKFAVLEVS